MLTSENLQLAFKATAPVAGAIVVSAGLIKPAHAAAIIDQSFPRNHAHIHVGATNVDLARLCADPRAQRGQASGFFHAGQLQQAVSLAEAYLTANPAVGQTGIPITMPQSGRGSFCITPIISGPCDNATVVVRRLDPVNEHYGLITAYPRDCVLRRHPSQQVIPQDTTQPDNGHRFVPLPPPPARVPKPVPPSGGIPGWLAPALRAIPPIIIPVDDCGQIHGMPNNMPCQTI